MISYPALPHCEPRKAGETLPEYAARVLRHLLATDCTATLTDEQLAQADTAACRAAAQLTGLDGKASALEPFHLQTLETLSAARHTIAQVTRWRAQQDAQEAAGGTTAPKGGTQPGRPAPLQPPPGQLPPTGAEAPMTDAQISQELGNILRGTPRKVPADGINF